MTFEKKLTEMTLQEKKDLLQKVSDQMISSRELGRNTDELLKMAQAVILSMTKV